MWKEVPRRSVGNPRAAAFCRYSGAASASRAPAGSRPAPTPDSVPLSPAWWLAAPRVAVLPDPGVRWACRRGWGGEALPGARGGLPRSALICVSSASPCLVIGWRRPPRAKRDRQVRGALGQVRALAPACRPVVRGGWVQPWVPGNPLFFPPSMRSCEFQTGGVHRGLPPRADCWKCLSSFLLGKNCKNVTVRSSRATPPWTRPIPSGLGSRAGSGLVSAWMGDQDGGPPGKPRCVGVKNNK